MKIIFKMKVLIFCICLLIKYILSSIRTALILHRIDSTRCWKHPTQISIHVDMLLQICCSVLMQFLSDPVWSSAVVHLLQGSICCTSKSALVHTLTVISGYKCFPVSLKQSGHSPLTLKKAFSFREWVFSVFQSCIPWRWLFDKIPQPQKINANAVWSTPLNGIVC